MEYWSNFYSLSGKDFAIDVNAKNVSGTTVQLTAGDTPFETQYSNDEDIMSPIHGQTGNIRMIMSSSDMLNILPENSLTNVVTLYVNDGEDVCWKGFVKAETSDQELDWVDREVTIPIVSPLEISNDIDWEEDDWQYDTSAITFYQLLGRINDKLGGLWDYVVFPDEGQISSLMSEKVYMTNWIDCSVADTLTDICYWFGWTCVEDGDKLLFLHIGRERIDMVKYQFSSVVEGDFTSGTSVESKTIDNISDYLFGTEHSISQIRGKKKVSVTGGSRYEEKDISISDLLDSPKGIVKASEDSNDAVSITNQGIYSFYHTSNISEHGNAQNTNKYFVDAGSSERCCGAEVVCYIHTDTDAETSSAKQSVLISALNNTDMFKIKGKEPRFCNTAEANVYAKKTITISGEALFCNDLDKAFSPNDYTEDGGIMMSIRYGGYYNNGVDGFESTQHHFGVAVSGGKFEKNVIIALSSDEGEPIDDYDFGGDFEICICGNANGFYKYVLLNSFTVSASQTWINGIVNYARCKFGGYENHETTFNNGFDEEVEIETGLNSSEYVSCNLGSVYQNDMTRFVVTYRSDGKTPEKALFDILSAYYDKSHIKYEFVARNNGYAFAQYTNFNIDNMNMIIAGQSIDWRNEEIKLKLIQL